MAGTTGFTFFHFGHADASADWATFVAALTAESLAVDVGIVAEHGVAGWDTVGNSAGGTAVTLAAIFFSCNAEGLFTVVAGTAGKALFHFSHGVGTLLGKIENCAVAGLAVFVLCKVCVVAEDNG